MIYCTDDNTYMLMNIFVLDDRFGWPIDTTQTSRRI